MVPSSTILQMRALHKVKPSCRIIRPSSYRARYTAGLYDELRHRRWVLHLLHTLVVEGIRKILWSVPQFTKQGHQIIFEGDIVKLILNTTGHIEGRLVLHIAYPYQIESA